MNGHLKLDINDTGISVDADVNGFKVNVAGDWQTLQPLFLLLWGQVQAEVAKKPNGWQGVLNGWGKK